MVKDWGMSEKIGLRTMTDSSKAYSGEMLGPATSEQVNIIFKKMTLRGNCLSLG